jgi:aspartate/methionine/tyrosine aminotransferase
VNASALSDAEHEAVTEPGLYWLDAGWLYPDGLAEPWMTEMPEGWRDTSPAWYARRLAGAMLPWAAASRLSGTLVSSCTAAFTVALAALTEPGDRVIVSRQSFDLWPARIEQAGRVPAYARRDPQGISLASVARLLAAGARALVIVQPENPLGTVLRPQRLRALARMCAGHGAALIADHALITCQPWGIVVPAMPPLAPEGLRYACLLDTGKAVHLGHAKAALVACPPALEPAVRQAAVLDAAAWPQHSLAQVHHVITHPRYDPHALERRVAANWNILAARTTSGLEMRRGAAGSGALASARGLTARRLARRLRSQGVLVIPVEGTRWCRVALARPADVILSLRRELHAAAAG